MNNIAGLVLAGGESSRMGRDKALLPWNGTTALAHQFALLQRVCDASRCFVSGPRTGFPGIPDLLPRLGPIGALHAAVHFAPLQHQSVLVLPVDMLLLDVRLLNRLMALAGDSRAAHFENAWLPAVLRIDAHVTKLLDRMVQRPSRERSLRTLFERLVPRTVPLAEPQQWKLTNANSPTDWRTLKRTHQRHLRPPRPART